MADQEYLLEMSGIRKRFAGVEALRNVQFNLRKGEVHALLGENGAGKSTLIKILGGIIKADEGVITINGDQVDTSTVKLAQENGISVIHQEIVLVPHLTVAENIFLGREYTNRVGFNDKQRMFQEAEEKAVALGLHVDVRSEVVKLTIAQRQMVEIVKRLSEK